MSTPTKNVLELTGLIVEVDDLTKTEAGKSEEQLQNMSEVDQLATKKKNRIISSARNNNARTMPTEIWLRTLSYLKTKDLENFRLSSNRSAMLGSEHFIQTFAFQANRLDLERKSDSRRDAEGRDVQQIAGKEPTDIREILSEYLVWYKSWNKAAQNYSDLTRMTKAFEGLKNASCIRFSTSTPNFKSEALTRAWAKVTLPKAYRGLWKTRELETVMLAAHNSNVKVRHFVHDPAPTAFLIQHLNQLESTLKPFRDRDSLELLCDGMQRPVRGLERSKRFWTGLWKAAQLAPNLEILRLGLLTGGYCDFYIYEYVPLRKVLGNFTWPSLTRLRIDDMILCEKDLTAFLLRHASSLRHITLKAENLRERLLTEAKLQFYQDNKDKDPGNFWLLMQEDGLTDELSARISEFVLSRGDWPSELISASWDAELAGELLDTRTANWAKLKNEPSYPSSKWALWDELVEETGVRALHDASFA
ncbi:hypothetical protein BHYA_0051g00470 [Botrytis hyacinthi]|uniref:F-box domain-containing protein n=1 Tax=Botrytis hyacinthi TaxID=278943 RepID=A0A4Z1GRQ4_9HELO|nr:hypothetical protein BHYA_0051g00470 [Botrytis hyacinthi]